MSLLLHFVAKLIFFSILAAVVLALLTWLTKNPKNDPDTRPIPGEYPEDKLTYVDRISAKHPYSSSRRALKDEQDRRRA
jgi:hypothetical protein